MDHKPSEERSPADVLDELAPVPKWRKATKRDVYEQAFIGLFVFALFLYAFLTTHNDRKPVAGVFGLLYTALGLRNFLAIRGKYRRGENIRAGSFSRNVIPKRPQ